MPSRVQEMLEENRCSCGHCVDRKEMTTAELIRKAAAMPQVVTSDYPCEVRSYEEWPICVDIRTNTNTGSIRTIFHHVNKRRISRAKAEEYLKTKSQKLCPVCGKEGLGMWSPHIDGYAYHRQCIHCGFYETKKKAQQSA